MTSERFQITEEKSVCVMRLMLPESIDTMEIDGLIESILKELQPETRKRWVVDLSDVTYMGSAMLGLFVNIRERIRQGGGTLVLCGISPPLMRIFHTCCLERLFNIAKTRAEALAMVKRD